MKGPYPLNICGVDPAPQMFVHSKTDAHISQQISQTGRWEVFETQLLCDLLSDDAIFIDVGANIGYYTVVASRVVGPGGRVFAFEPEADNFALLEENIRCNQLDNVHAVRAALSDCNSSGHIYLNEENRGDHQIFRQAGNDRANRTSQSIELLNGADYLQQQRVERIDVLKIDTQGAEAAVVSGLMPLIRNSLPDINIIIEFTPYSLAQAGSSGMALLDLIDSLSLPLQLIDHIGHKLMPYTYQDMQQWIKQTDDDIGNEGFINLQVGKGV